MTSPYIYSILILLFLCFSAFFSASETALFSIPRERVSFFQKGEKRRERWICLLLRNGQRTLLLILLGNLFVNITLVGLIHSLLRSQLPDSTALLTMVIATGTILVFGEMLPKNMALKHNVQVALLTAPVLTGLMKLSGPLLTVTETINSYFLIRVRMLLRHPSPFVTVDELKSGVIASRDRGAISDDEQDMIVALLERGALPVSRFMIHRSGLILLPESAGVGVALEKCKVLRHTFVLVFNRKNTGQVTGMVSLAALLKSDRETRLGALVSSMLWVSDTMEVAEVINIMFEKGRSEAGVIDEHGSFIGIIMQSEGLKSILAPVLDTGEMERENNVFEKNRVFRGNTEVMAMVEWLPPGLLKKKGLVRTLNGLLTEYLGTIPHTGDKFAIDGWNFYIISASPTKIERVLIRKGNHNEY